MFLGVKNPNPQILLGFLALILIYNLSYYSIKGKNLGIFIGVMTPTPKSN